jgi:hypothetical protein
VPIAAGAGNLGATAIDVVAAFAGRIIGRYSFTTEQGTGAQHGTNADDPAQHTGFDGKSLMQSHAE